MQIAYGCLNQHLQVSPTSQSSSDTNIPTTYFILNPHHVDDKKLKLVRTLHKATKSDMIWHHVQQKWCRPWLELGKLQCYNNDQVYVDRYYENETSQESWDQG